MITAQTIRSDGSAYLDKHLRKNDYWEDGEKDIGGVWFGAAAERLGLVPGLVVLPEQFGALADNRHPVDGSKLTARDKSHRKSFTDIQLSAPKDVSVLALLGDDPRVQEAFRASVGVGLASLERFSAVRERRGEMATSDEARLTGNMVAAVYFHDSSRLLDPQLHAHGVVANLSWDEATNRWLALQSRDMMRASAFCRRVMYDDLARRLGELGYECYGMNKDGFSVRGVEHLRERYSKRTVDIEDAAKAFEQREGRPPSDDERAILTRETRGDKLTEISTEKVRAMQRSQLSTKETRDLDGLVTRAKSASEPGQKRSSPARVSDAATLDEYLAVGFVEANERRSVAWEWDALEAATAHAQANGVHLDAAALVERLRARGTGDSADLHAAPGFRVTTSAVLAEEREMANLALSGRGAFGSPVADLDRLRQTQLAPRLSREHEAKKAVAREWRADQGLPPDPALAENPVEGILLSDEQMAAAQTLAGSRDGVSILVGDAGTGKTASLSALRDASTKRWVALGPTTRARDELHKGGFSDADTLQSFLLSPKKQKAARGSVVLVDEAGTMGTPETRKLLEIARREKIQVVLVGDPKQHASVIRGDALRAILKESAAVARLGEDHALPVARLKTVRRQERTEDREISESLARGEFGQAVNRQEAAGYIKEEKDEIKLVAEAAAYLVERRTALAANDRKAAGKPGFVLGITPRWEDAAKLNAAMRPLLRKAGQLSGEDRPVRTIEPDGGFTAASKRLPENYLLGKHALTFVRDCESIGAKAGQSWIVEKVEKDGLTVRRMDVPVPRLGQRRQAPPPAQKVAWADLRDANVGRIKEISLAVGDDILLRASCRTGKKTSVANGTVQRVKSIGKDGRIALVGGGVLPADFHHFTHGYGITSHKSQGASEREAIVVMGDAACSGASRRQWYVSSSRHKESARYFVADLTKVRTALGRDDSRELAGEMVERRNHAERSQATGPGKPAAAVAAEIPVPSPQKIASVLPLADGPAATGPESQANNKETMDRKPEDDYTLPADSEARRIQDVFAAGRRHIANARATRGGSVFPTDSRRDAGAAPGTVSANAAPGEAPARVAPDAPAVLSLLGKRRVPPATRTGAGPGRVAGTEIPRSPGDAEAPRSTDVPSSPPATKVPSQPVATPLPEPAKPSLVLRLTRKLARAPIIRRVLPGVATTEAVRRMDAADAENAPAEASPRAKQSRSRSRGPNL